MTIYNVHAGHNFNVSGSSGYFSETVEDRNVKDAVISKLQSLNFTVYDCTDDSGKTQNENLANIVSKCNTHAVDLNISIHFNASNGQGHGVEVLQYSNRTKTVAQNICNAIAQLGFKNRGVKDRTDLYVLKHTKAPAILIECCFCDSAIDAGLYNYDSMATAIVKGLTGQVENQLLIQRDNWFDRLKAECKRQGFSNYPTIKEGAKGDITKLVQERLNSVGFNISVDGIYGLKTKNAIKVFQKNRGLIEDGIIGSNTWKYLISGEKY
ncbi:N-acetylmuramoyl-L-alanine amidase [Thomasclavelia sp.]